MVESLMEPFRCACSSACARKSALLAGEDKIVLQPLLRHVCLAVQACGWRPALTLGSLLQVSISGSMGPRAVSGLR